MVEKKATVGPEEGLHARPAALTLLFAHVRDGTRATLAGLAAAAWALRIREFNDAVAVIMRRIRRTR